MPTKAGAASARDSFGHAPARLLFLRERFAWMGTHSGYDQLFPLLAEGWPHEAESIYRTRSVLRNLLYTPLEWLTWPRTGFYNGDSLAAELAAHRLARRRASALLHVAYVENNLRLLARDNHSVRARLVGTAHQPPGWWERSHGHPELLNALDALVVMSTSQLRWFDEVLAGRVHLIRHGVDTAFFSPRSDAARDEPSEPRCVFGGHWMRDLPTLRRAADELLRVEPTLRFDLIVPRAQRGAPEFEALARHDRVNWHDRLSDERLREIYRSARLAFLPLVDSTANNTLLEAMACALPIVTNDVGGVREYTDTSFATRAPPGDVDGMVEAARELIDDRREARQRGALARDHATREFGWPAAAERTLALYESLLSRDRRE